jgi:C-terminal processing protease CtpA/Prc
MIKGHGRFWYGGLAAVLALAMVATLAQAGTAGSKKHKEKKGYLGVLMQELDEDVREGLGIEVDSGVLISGVEEDSPADEAGLKDGDVIVAFNGEKVRDPGDLRDLVRETAPGEQVEIEVVRDGQTRKIELTLGEWPGDLGWLSLRDLHFDREGFGRGMDQLRYALWLKPRLGVEVAELNEDLAGYFKTKPGEGVLVLEVDDESVAGDAGVKAGDVIVGVGDESVSTTDDLRQSVADYEEGDEFPIHVVRKGKKKTLTATMDDVASGLWWSGKAHDWDYGRQLPNVHGYRMRVPDVKQYVEQDLRKEIDQMKKELKELKEELKELKK